MNIRLVVKNPYGGIEETEYEDVQYDLLGSFLLITLSNGVEKVFPVQRIHFVEVTP